MEKCSECGKEFGSVEALEQHVQMKHKKTDETKSRRKFKISKKYVIVVVLIMALASGIYAIYSYSAAPGQYDNFAKCLGENGAVFYGAFWCPHCQEQKALFGKSAKYLPYVECSTPDGTGQLDVCRQAGVQSYPTWEFADGSRLTGSLSLDRLAQKTSCPLDGSS